MCPCRLHKGAWLLPDELSCVLLRPSHVCIQVHCSFQESQVPWEGRNALEARGFWQASIGWEPLIWVRISCCRRCGKIHPLWILSVFGESRKAVTYLPPKHDLAEFWSLGLHTVIEFLLCLLPVQLYAWWEHDLGHLDIFWVIRLCVAPLYFKTPPKRHDILSVVLMLKLHSHSLEQADVFPYRCVGIERRLTDNTWMWVKVYSWIARDDEDLHALTTDLLDFPKVGKGERNWRPVQIFAERGKPWRPTKKKIPEHLKFRQASARAKQLVITNNGSFPSVWLAPPLRSSQ